MSFRTPYLMFLADAPDQLAAKTAAGVAHWRPDWCIGQLRLEGCKADLKLPDMSVEEAAAAGIGTVIVGVANRGGRLSPASIAPLKKALELGMDLASGLHIRLAEVPELKAAAAANGRTIADVRHPTEDFDVGTGEKRGGKRLLAVGTDCSVGKMYTTLALEAEMLDRGMKADFRATGQTGIFIAGSGVSVDAVVSDFISGAVEKISPANDPDHWDIIEGQGSLFHASFAGVSLGLLHGAQADALVMCHEPTRTHMRGLPQSPLPDLADCIALNETCARLTNPAAKVIGFSVNCSALDDAATDSLLKGLEDRFGMPAVDPVKRGVGPLADIVATM
ncbi:MAG: N-acetyltransferase DgcN [Rhodospirillales bacterium]